MPFLRVPSAEIFYQQWGDGPPVLLAHGAGGNHMSWWQQVPALSTQYTCIVFDHPGYGRSTWSETAAETAIYGDVMVEFLDALKIEHCAFIAQSMGGWSALGLTCRQPQRVAALVLTSTFCGVSSPVIDPLIATRDKKLDRQRTACRDRLPGSFNPALGQRAAQEHPELHTLYEMISSLNPPPVHPPQPYTAQDGRTVTQALPVRRGWGQFTADDLRRVSAPTLLISGEEDIIAPPAVMDEMARLIPDSALKRVPKSGHSVYFQRPELFNRLVLEHLSRAYEFS